MMIALREAEGVGNSPRLCNGVWAAWSMPYHLSQFCARLSAVLCNAQPQFLEV